MRQRRGYVWILVLSVLAVQSTAAKDEPLKGKAEVEKETLRIRKSFQEITQKIPSSIGKDIDFSTGPSAAMQEFIEGKLFVRNLDIGYAPEHWYSRHLAFYYELKFGEMGSDREGPIAVVRRIVLKYDNCQVGMNTISFDFDSDGKLIFVFHGHSRAEDRIYYHDELPIRFVFSGYSRDSWLAFTEGKEETSYNSSLEDQSIVDIDSTTDAKTKTRLLPQSKQFAQRGHTLLKAFLVLFENDSNY